MDWSSVRTCAVLELLVMVFQVGGLSALCLYRLAPMSRWAERARIANVVALFGLGIAGALCGRHDSEFALFAGGTMTVLFIGMTMGSGHHEPAATTRRLAVEPNLAN